MVCRQVLLGEAHGGALRRRWAGDFGQPTPERMAEWEIVAQRAIDDSLELADELKAT